MMMSFRAAALLIAFAALLTECLSAHSDRSRQRTGPIRSVPVAADVKRDADFNCPEEFGYYPHPSDCTLYYVCVFGGALLESCTGGLMYSHELQTCDWPRNVGCDAIGAIDSDEIERVIEKKPLASVTLPRRAPPALPPPPQRIQPNPIVTSRGQPKFTREEYEKQQQLYAEVDDLPPVEEIESDRQQRVYRGQPSTIGQVQRDRDGYGQVSSGRTLNSNIIPASIPHSNNGKIGSFSFGTQVEDRRTTATQAPQSFSEDTSDLTDILHDRQSETDKSKVNSDTREKKIFRRKREAVDLKETENVTEKPIEINSTLGLDDISKRNDHDLEEYVETETEFHSGETDESDEDGERGKRQVRHGRYYFKDGFKNSGKNWGNSNLSKYVNIPQISFIPPNSQNVRYQSNFNSLNSNNFFDGSRKPFLDQNQFSTANPFHSYQTEHQSDKPFKPSLPDFSSQKQAYNPINSATQIITKSPPISTLTNNENPFAALAGGFYNNNPKPTNNQNLNKQPSQIFNFNTQPSNQNHFHDSSHVSSKVVTGKPVLIQTPRTENKLRQNPDLPKKNVEIQNSRDPNQNIYYNHKPNPTFTKAYQPASSSEEEVNSSEENSSEKEENDNHSTQQHFPDPPYEFTHPSNKFADINNPFADPNFDFDDFLSKLKDGPKRSEVTTTKPKYNSPGFRPIKPLSEGTTLTPKTGFRSSTLNYHGMSTPRPFSMPTGEPSPNHNQEANVQTTTKKPIQLEQISQRPNQQQILENHRPQENYRLHNQQSSLNENTYNRPVQTNAGTPLDAIRPKLKPPNFQDDRQLPLNYNFHQALQSNVRSTTERIQFKNEKNNNHFFSVTQKPLVVHQSATGSTIYFTSPKQQHFSTGKPYLVSSIKPNNIFAIKKSTPRPMTTANEHLSALQQYWNNKQAQFEQRPTRPTPVSDMPSLESLFSQGVKSTALSHLSDDKLNVVQSYSPKPSSTTTTTKAPFPRRPIPKPSPEMSDYYYDDDDEQYYYEPPVKSQYMPSSEVRPRRPPMAQNYQEYEDSESYEADYPGPQKLPVIRPVNYNTYKTDSETKNHNEVSIVTKRPHPNKELIKSNIKNIIVLNHASSTPNARPEVSNYKVLLYPNRNKTMHIKRPESGPYTATPPKYLNQTTLRPYTVRHRLAKPTTVQTHMTQTTQAQDMKTTRVHTRHPNIVTQTRTTTPRDSHNQETRYTKTQHDDRTNSLEPTESVSSTPFQPSPRPKMLYNGSQSYNPEQYDPYYAVYDEDGELYKDTDYVQHYNLASLRPAVQQTYRGTPPPARRPVETFTTRPGSPDDYDDALIQGQINSNQNQYQTPIRHSTRGEGNELGFDNSPSSVRTTVFEATSISTTPSTTSSTSTTTTTQRPTVAPFTEAMTPSRYVTRLSTENPVQNPELSVSNQQLSNNAFPSSIPLTSLPVVNFSDLAKPFEKTDNLYRLREILTSTERLPRLSFHKSNNDRVETKKTNINTEDKKVVSLTSGFSIRRNLNNTDNPYTLTVLSKPFESYGRSREINKNKNKLNKQKDSKIYYYENDNVKGESEKSNRENENTESKENTSSDRSMRRTDSSQEIVSDEQDVPIYVRPTAKLRVVEPEMKTSSSPTTTIATKFFLKTIIKRPVPFSLNNEQNLGSTENNIDTEVLIERALLNSRNEESNITINETSPQWDPYDQLKEPWNEPAVGPYDTLNNLRNSYTAKDDYIFDTSTSTSTPRYTPFKAIDTQNTRNIDRSSAPSTKPSYYAYRILDEQVKPDHTTEIFNTKAKSILRAFINNFVSTPRPRHIHIISSTPRPIQDPEKIDNIGFHKKLLKYDNEVPFKKNVPRLQIITEPIESRYVNPTISSIKFIQPETKTEATMTTTQTPVNVANYETTRSMTESTTNSQYYEIPSSVINYSRFSTFVKTDNPENLNSQKFHKIVNEEPSTESVANVHENVSYNNEDNELTNLTKTKYDTEKDFNNFEPERQVNQFSSTTTRTIKGTTTVKNIEPTTSTKSLSFPTRASRVNPAIKLAAANPAGGRRSYQSSSKCSSDNSLQENLKCNEIKYQRPSSLPGRGRGSAHYSTSGVEASQQPQQPQQIPNRGTPPTRSRPTLKPSTAIVSKNTEFVDIYAYPPSRPSAVYPQPTPDKTAAKCRKDVCLLPDCSCGGKEIPGDMPVESVPQIVLLTFDDSVNDLNKVLYQDLFEKGRVNPNGCPISATFYVSHEWTDYSQVQNLYAGGHEMASHTISHSFGEQFSQKKWNREVAGQREILSAYGGVKLEDVRGMRAPFLSVGGNKMFKMLYDSNFTYDSSMPVYENRPPSWPYTLDYKLFHDCMIPPCPTKSYPGVWEVPMVMWQDLNGGRCSMGDACANPPEAEGVYKMLLKNFDRHYTTNRAPFGLFYHAAWFTQPHHKEGFIMFLDFINRMNDVWIVTNWQALQWVRDPTPINRLNNFQPFQCDYPDRPKKCNNPKVCNLWHKSGVRYMRTCQPCPEIYPWTGKSGIRSSRIDNDIEE